MDPHYLIQRALCVQETQNAEKDARFQISYVVKKKKNLFTDDLFIGEVFFFLQKAGMSERKVDLFRLYWKTRY